MGARKMATYEDLRNLPDHIVGEIVDGELFASPRPASRHGLISSCLGVELGGRFGRSRGGDPGGWWIVDEPETHIADQVMVPDLAGWRRERMPVFPDAPYFDLVPDWICEVLSPGTAAFDRIRKLPHYARAGVRHAWLIDPAPKTLEIFRLVAGVWTLASAFEGNDTVRAEPFDAIDLDLAAVWGE